MRRDQSQAGSDYRRAHNAQMWREREHIRVSVPKHPHQREHKTGEQDGPSLLWWS